MATRLGISSLLLLTQSLTGHAGRIADTSFQDPTCATKYGDCSSTACCANSVCRTTPNSNGASYKTCRPTSSSQGKSSMKLVRDRVTYVPTENPTTSPTTSPATSPTPAPAPPTLAPTEAPTEAPGGGARLSAEEVEAILDRHNLYRCMHGTQRMTWNADLAAQAQTHADGHKFEHSKGEARYLNGIIIGENIAYMANSFSYPGERATRLWYAEVQHTRNFGELKHMQDSEPQGKVIGHYSQIVWKSSTELGCAQSWALLNGYNGTLWVCQYKVAGNWGGFDWTKEVSPQRESHTACGGVDTDVPSSSLAFGSR